MDESMPIRCPATGRPLIRMALADAERVTGHLYAREGTPFGRTGQVLLRDDHAAAYPIADQMPILLAPEVLTTTPPQPDLRDPRWCEAYEEMEFYNKEAAEPRLTISQSLVDRLLRHAGTAAFPSPQWLDAPYDAAAQLDAYRHLGAAANRRVAQLGGKGIHAVKRLLAGAGEAWLVTPMGNEVRWAYELARRTGVVERFRGVVGIAEQLPVANESFDAIYSGGCLHHMMTAFAGPEIRRALVPGGRFAAVEPWQTVMHGAGTWLVGKREANAYCRPLNEERLAPMKATFARLRLSHHGPVLRYLALGALKFTKREISPKAGLRMTRVDDALPLPRRMGGSIAVLAIRD